MSAMSAALAIGHTGAEGKATGAMFSMLALATAARIAIVAAQLPKDPGIAGMLAAAPVIAWVLAALLLALALRLRPA